MKFLKQLVLLSFVAVPVFFLDVSLASAWEEKCGCPYTCFTDVPGHFVVGSTHTSLGGGEPHSGPGWTCWFDNGSWVYGMACANWNAPACGPTGGSTGGGGGVTPPPITSQIGVCGQTSYSCTTGTSFDNWESSEVFYWRCRGTGQIATQSDNNQTSCAYFKLLDGVCLTAATAANGVDYKNSCAIGSPTNATESASDYSWDCLGTGPPTHPTRGATAVGCSRTKIGNGTINITSNKTSASWTLYGYGVNYANLGNPTIIRSSDPPKSYADMPPGIYQVRWEGIPDDVNGTWRTPTWDIRTLLPNGTVSFNGIYTFTSFKVVVRDATISDPSGSDFVVADGVTPYTITVTAENFLSGGGNNINFVQGYVNSESTARHYGRSPANFWFRPAGSFLSIYNPYVISCNGGGTAVDPNEYWLSQRSAAQLISHPRVYRLISCRTSVSGNTRTVSFTTLVYPAFMYHLNAGGNNGPYDPSLERDNILNGWASAVGGTWANGGTVEVDSWSGMGPKNPNYFNAGLVSASYTLSVTKDGTGSGAFTMTDGATPPNIVPSTGINCVGMPCTGTESIPSGGTRIITANPDISSVTWTGCTSVVGNICTVSNVTRNTSLTATFTRLSDPSVDSLTANPNPVAYDTASELTWSASGSALFCYITGGRFTSLDWFGTFVGGPSGSMSTNNLIVDTPYTLNCHNGVAWAMNPKTVTVTVLPNSGTLKICPNPCNFSGTSFNGRTLTGVPVTPLYACYGTGDCSAPDTNVSATWSAVNSPNNAIKFRGVAGTSTVSSSVNIDSDYFGLFSANEEIKLSYPSASDATMNIIVSCQEKACSELSAQTNAYCRGEYRDLVEDRCNHTVNCEGAKNCNYTFKETSP